MAVFSFTHSPVLSALLLILLVPDSLNQSFHGLFCSCLGPSSHFCLGPSTHFCLGPSSHFCLGPSTRFCLEPSTCLCLGPSTCLCLGPSTHFCLGPSTHFCHGPSTCLCLGPSTWNAFPHPLGQMPSLSGLLQVGPYGISFPKRPVMFSTLCCCLPAP